MLQSLGCEIKVGEPLVGISFLNDIPISDYLHYRLAIHHGQEEKKQ